MKFKKSIDEGHLVRSIRIIFYVIIVIGPTTAFGQSLDQLITEMVDSMGGYKAWTEIPVIRWTFDNRQTFYWDKTKDSVIMDRASQNLLVKFDLNSKKGSAWKSGEKVQDTQVGDYLDNAYLSWVNDSYWLAMPFKLKDPGVNLTYIGRGKETDDYHQIEITYNKGIGITPRNKYLIWINHKTSLINKWAFYIDRDDPEPVIVNKWSNYQQFGGVLFSLDREFYHITNVAVLDQLPKINDLLGN
ncbi:MAG: DUF6503 family protein [Bacteroidota bacterium]